MFKITLKYKNEETNETGSMIYSMDQENFNFILSLIGRFAE